MRGIVTLLTDFGTQDGYVGAMKGTVLSECPSATVVDLTHDVPPQDVLGGAFALAQAARFFPAGTIHVAVVDPGVGSRRRALIVEHGGQVFIGPDNGLLSLAAPSPGHVIDTVPPTWRVHPTFHGRDLFARIAGCLAAGASITEFADEEARPSRLAIAEPERQADGSLRGEVIHVDRFGNLILNLTDVPRDRPAAVELAGMEAPCLATFSDVGAGQLVAYRGSAGYLEVAVRNGSAAGLLRATRGTPARLVSR